MSLILITNKQVIRLSPTLPVIDNVRQETCLLRHFQGLFGVNLGKVVCPCIETSLYHTNVGKHSVHGSSRRRALWYLNRGTFLMESTETKRAGQSLDPVPLCATDSDHLSCYLASSAGEFN